MGSGVRWAACAAGGTGVRWTACAAGGIGARWTACAAAGRPRVALCAIPSVPASCLRTGRRRGIPAPAPPDACVHAGVSWHAAYTSALRIVQRPHRLSPFLLPARFLKIKHNIAELREKPEFICKDTGKIRGRAAVGRASGWAIRNAERREKTRSTCMDTGETGGPPPSSPHSQPTSQPANQPTSQPANQPN